MPVLGYSIKDLNATRKPLSAGKIDINSIPRIKDVRERSMDIPGMVGKKDPVVGIDFEFQTEYKPEVGSIKIAGEVIYTGLDNKKILKEWEKNKKLPIEVEVEVKNFLLKKCLLLGIDISEEMQLPPPIAIPMIRLVEETKDKKKSPDYIG